MCYEDLEMKRIISRHKHNSFTNSQLTLFTAFNSWFLVRLNTLPGKLKSSAFGYNIVENVSKFQKLQLVPNNYA